ncbi:MAG: hypothetical protein HYZ10_10310 [Ignavibacteriales bacterium]|nr:hypothetical protein [Ignavibacteriales bacterium]
MIKNKNKDYPLKLATKILYDQLGLVSYYEVMLRNKSYISQFKVHDVSDIDVIGFNILPDLTVIKNGAECKSGEGNALEEMFKFLGVMGHYNLAQGFLIKTKIHQNAREISANHNIMCYTESELRQLLIGFGVDVDKQLEIENAKYLSLQEAISIGKNFNDKLHSYITLDYWNKDNWKNIHNLLHILKNSQELTLFEDSNIKLTQFLFYVMGLLSLSIIQNVQKSIKINFSDIERSLEISLYGTAEDYNEKKKIHDAVNIATNSQEKFEPDWQPFLINISTRFAQKTREASKIVSLFQDIVENSFYKDKIVINDKILKNYSDVTIKFAKDVCSLITNFSTIKESLFAELMNK